MYLFSLHTVKMTSLCSDNKNKNIGVLYLPDLHLNTDVNFRHEILSASILMMILMIWIIFIPISTQCSLSVLPLKQYNMCELLL